ncbi:uncharacterized protein N7482_009851 [Penicillium canariense]|uniref:Metalloendopeptidase n=1 Tax=Penicillium canariense TaxID=189055 RepID=A0A9W9HQW3_9EURO|nr:uncharacterized protein N7482_009851 [Penicillium canariense]KAJ5153373.1 hypothetical protein N7482_009851 [Penicillium canariense]
MKSLLQLLIGICLLHYVLSCPDPDFDYSSIQQNDGSVQKRGYTLKDRSWNVWPDAKIIYCFDPTDGGLAKRYLKPLIPKAWDLWKAAGLNKQFKMEQGTDDYCTDANRGSYLLVKYNSEGELVTTPGYSASMSTTILDPSDAIGSGSGVANIAHELGHAWGLLHEHQRVGLWTKDYGGTGATNMFTFTCENMADYEKIEAQRLAKGKDMNLPCHYEAVAKTARFIAYNLLPDQDGLDRGPAGEVDWDSIMIYGSTAGSKTVNGQRLNTLVKASDGSTFGYNQVPSEGDIQTLNWFYTNELGDASKNVPVPFWKTGSKFRGIFNRKNQNNNCL